MQSIQPDIIIVGGGAAGCVLANRLSADPDLQVLLIEAGPPDRNPMIHMPKGVGKVLADPGHIWSYQVRGREGDNRAPASWVRGKTLGGSSSTNGMMYVRGKPDDFDDFAALTSSDWSWDEISRCYTELEGEAGLRTSLPPERPELNAVIFAGEEMGLEIADDPNDPACSHAVGYCPQTVWKGRRQSAAAAFLTPVRERANLVVETGVTIDKVLIEDGKTVGVAGLRNGEPVEWHAPEIVLSAGTFGSPAILQRSGIGDRALLENLGIICKVALPEVGENLFEHCGITLQWKTLPGMSLNKAYSRPRLLANAVRYYLTHSGPLASGTFDVVGWFRTDGKKGRPNAQMLFAPHSIDRTAKSMATESFPGIQAVIYPLRPRARGRVAITSKNPTDLPAGTIDFFTDEDDRRELVDTVRFVRRLAQTDPLSRIIVSETRPGPATQADDQIIDAYRNLGTPAYHAAGTCRMGSDEKAVVDPRCRVRGIEGLKVVDLSIAPIMPAGNTFGPVCAMAWRAAELIGEDISANRKAMS